MTAAELIEILQLMPRDASVYLDEDGTLSDDFEPELRVVDMPLYDNIVDSPHVNVQPKLGDKVVLL